MLKKSFSILLFTLIISGLSLAQNREQIVENIINEATENSNLERLAYELLDLNGPRLVGTTQQQNAHNWAVNQFKEWGISAENKQFGEWQGWERGITHIDLLYPRVVSLSGMQLAWSPSTSDRGVTAETITMPEFADEAAFTKWLPSVKGKFVLASMPQMTGRPDYNWEKFATEESIEKMRQDRSKQMSDWRDNLSKTGKNTRELNEAFEAAGAVGIVASNWSRGFGANKIFGAQTEKIPMVDLSLEDYGMLYRLTENGAKPRIKVTATS